VVIILLKNSITLFTKRYLLSLNNKETITLLRPRICPLLTLIHALILPALWLAPTVIAIYVSPAKLIRLIYPFTIRLYNTIAFVI
jgi:hypothetical protein